MIDAAVPPVSSTKDISIDEMEMEHHQSQKNAFLQQGSMHLPIRPKTTEMPGTNIATIRAPPDSSSVIKTCSMTEAEFCPAI